MIRSSRSRKSLVLVALMGLASCKGSEPSSGIEKESGRNPLPGIEEQALPQPGEDPTAGTAPAMVGSESLRVGLGWLTDGPNRRSCRIWVRLEWNPVAGRFENTERLPLPSNRPRKAHVFIDAKPWSLHTDVSGSAQARDASSGAPIGEPLALNSAGRDYQRGPQVGLIFRDGLNDWLRSDTRPEGRAEQDLDLHVIHRESGRRVIQARLRLAVSDSLPSPCN
ncbi:MAG: hypothetical protein IT285_05400 [Bdellovibrionales bacterium]|nr:hypothetical protein [Bdellovibrionales bacterium]